MKTKFFMLMIACCLLSCSKSSQKDCEKNNTGSILFHNDPNGFNPDSLHVFKGSTDLGMVKLNGQLNIDNLPAGKDLYTFKYMGIEIYSDSVVVTQCNSTHYFIDWNPVSDRRLKKNITPLKNALSNIEALNIYSFDYNAPKNYSGYLPKGTHFGFMAQELKNVYPEFVQLNANGYYSVNYMEMIPILAQGIKEQQEEINDLKKEIAELKSMVKSQQSVAMK